MLARLWAQITGFFSDCAEGIRLDAIQMAGFVQCGFTFILDKAFPVPANIVFLGKQRTVERYGRFVLAVVFLSVPVCFDAAARLWNASARVPPELCAIFLALLVLLLLSMSRAWAVDEKNRSNYYQYEKSETINSQEELLRHPDLRDEVGVAILLLVLYLPLSLFYANEAMCSSNGISGCLFAGQPTLDRFFRFEADTFFRMAFFFDIPDIFQFAFANGGPQPIGLGRFAELAARLIFDLIIFAGIFDLYKISQLNKKAMEQIEKVGNRRDEISEVARSVARLGPRVVHPIVRRLEQANGSVEGTDPQNSGTAGDAIRVSEADVIRDPVYRCMAETLGHIRHPKAISELAGLLKHRTSTPRAYAANAIRDIFEYQIVTLDSSTSEDAPGPGRELVLDTFRALKIGYRKSAGYRIAPQAIQEAFNSVQSYANRIGARSGVGRLLERFGILAKWQVPHSLED